MATSDSPLRPHAGTARKADVGGISETKINTREKTGNDGMPRQPHERDETPDDQASVPRPRIEQAARDLEQGLVDTDMHGIRGQETVTKALKEKPDMGGNAGNNAGSNAASVTRASPAHRGKKNPG